VDISLSTSFVNSKIDTYLSVSKMLSEKEIIEGCKKGKRRAQHALYNKYCGSMFGVALRYSRNKSEAEDVLQEAFIRIFKYIVDFEGRNEGSLTAWVKTIVINTTLSHNRNNKKHHYTEDVDDVQVGEKPIFDVSSDLDLTVERKNMVMKAMQKLPDGYRTVFNLYSVEGYSHKEIAEILDISENTSKSQLSKARKYLRTLLGVKEPQKKKSKEWIPESLMI
jgi:RNA polymerase sigma-70 factor (ECF subfamily)